MLSVGALSASAAGSCCETSKCSDKKGVQEFTQETAALSSALKAKDIELREQFLSDAIDPRKVDALEAELKELKNKLRIAGEKLGISPCCIG